MMEKSLPYFDICVPTRTCAPEVVGYLYREPSGTWAVGGDAIWARTYTKRQAIGVALRTLRGGMMLRRVVRQEAA